MVISANRPTFPAANARPNLQKVAAGQAPVDLSEISSEARQITPSPSRPNVADWLAQANTSPQRGDLTGLKGPLAKHQQMLQNVADKYNIDPRFMGALSQHMTKNGTDNEAMKKNNLFGLIDGRGNLKQFETPEASATKVGRLLTNPKGFYRGLDTIRGIGSRYAPNQHDPSWLPNVTRNYEKLGGDPTKPVLSQTR